MKKKDKRRVTVIIILLMALSLAAGIIWYAALSARSSAFFRVKDIVFISDTNMDVSYLMGRNIFDIDLKSEFQTLRNSYPQVRISGITKRFPDKIIIDARRRTAVAQLKSYRYLYIDEEAVILPQESDYGSNALPLIVGIESKVSRPKYGWSYSDLKEIKLALKLIKELKNNVDTGSLNVDKIDVSNPGNLSFYIRPYSLSIRIGDEDIRRRVRLLGVLLRKIGTKLEGLSYIDLRFSEPVVKPK